MQTVTISRSATARLARNRFVGLLSSFDRHTDVIISPFPTSIISNNCCKLTWAIVRLYWNETVLDRSGTEKVTFEPAINYL